MLTLSEVHALRDRVQRQLGTDFSNTICLRPERHNPQEHKTMTNGPKNVISTSAGNFIDSIL